MNNSKADLSDKVAGRVGSWPFVIGQAILLALYVVWNSIPSLPHFDPFPFIFLNLMLSLQAAFTAPLILISHNRMAHRDRELAAIDRENTHRILLSIRRLERNLIKEVNDGVEEIKEAVEELESDEET